MIILRRRLLLHHHLRQLIIIPMPQGKEANTDQRRPFLFPPISFSVTQDVQLKKILFLIFLLIIDLQLHL